MIIKKVETSFGGGFKASKNHGYRGYFEFQAIFLSVSTHHLHQPCLKGVFWCLTTTHKISSQNIGRKILFLNKIKKFTMWPSYFLG